MSSDNPNSLNTIADNLDNGSTDSGHPVAFRYDNDDEAVRNQSFSVFQSSSIDMINFENQRERILKLELLLKEEKVKLNINQLRNENKHHNKLNMLITY